MRPLGPRVGHPNRRVDAMESSDIMSPLVHNPVSVCNRAQRPCMIQLTSFSACVVCHRVASGTCFPWATPVATFETHKFGGTCSVRYCRVVHVLFVAPRIDRRSCGGPIFIMLQAGKASGANGRSHE